VGVGLEGGDMAVREFAAESLDEGVFLGDLSTSIRDLVLESLDICVGGFRLHGENVGLRHLADKCCSGSGKESCVL